MKRLITCLIALALVICAVVSVSAEISPTATAVRPPSDIIDVNPVGPDNPNIPWPPVEDPFDIIDNGDGTFTIIAKDKDGYQFSHWDFITGAYEIIDGSLTSPTITIRPTTGDKIKVDAHFSEENAPVTAPSSRPVPPPNHDQTSPITGEIATNSGNAFVVYGVVSAVVALAVVALAALKKRARA